MKKISFSLLHGQYPFGLSILSFLQICFAYLIIFRSNTAGGEFISFFNALISCLFIILEVIFHFINRKRAFRQTQARYIIGKPLTYFQVRKKFNYKLLLLFFLLAIVSVIPNTFLACYLFNHISFFSNIQAFTGIVFTWLFSFIFFRRKLLRHQMLGLGLIAIMIIVYFCVLYRTFQQTILFVYSSTGMLIGFITIYNACESLREVIEKYLMQIHYISHFLLLFSEGVLSLIALITISFSISKSACERLFRYSFFYAICYGAKWEFLRENFNEYFDKGVVSILLFVAYGILFFFNSLMRILTNKKLSPSHRYISEISFSFYYIVLVRLCRIFGKEFEALDYFHTDYLTLELVQFIVIFIACFIYNEYIIIHCCKLDTETTQEIMERGQNETDSIVKAINEGSNMEIDDEVLD